MVRRSAVTFAREMPVMATMSPKPSATRPLTATPPAATETPVTSVSPETAERMTRFFALT